MGVPRLAWPDRAFEPGLKGAAQAGISTNSWSPRCSIDAGAEDDLPFISDKALAKLRISREDLYQVFVMSAELMKVKTATDRVRPVASETVDGNWTVRLVRYSPLNDPMMKRTLGGPSRPCPAKTRL
jgi:hypothetical protein